jgi:hypothetical protein
VKIHLPATLEAPPTSLSEPKARPAGGGEVVLVVEDEPDVRRMAERILTKGGYSVVGMTNGPDAIAFLEREDQPIDLVLTDVIMPEMLGTELVEKVRELRPEMRVIYMSGYSHEVLAPRALRKNGSSAFIEKPFNARDLLRAVRELLEAEGRQGAADA